MSNKKRGEEINVKETVEEYLNQSDWRVAANSNAGYSFGGLAAHIHGKVIANYALNEIYSDEIGEAHRNGDFHIHDLDHGFGLYCLGGSLRALLEEGLGGVPGRTESAPPSHLDTAVAQIVNFMGSIANEIAGAVAFSSLDTYLAPFIKKDKLDYKRVKQLMQNLVFNLNISSRWSSQTPFSNFTFDLVCPKDMTKKQPIIGGKIMEFTYGDCQKEMELLTKCFLEVMEEGDCNGRTFTFPIPTFNITKNFDWESENSKILFSLAAKYGTPYFSNFVNSDLDPSDVRSLCCRLRLDMRELMSRGGGLFGAGEQTGSIGVVTINLARIGYTSKGSKEEYFKQLDKLLNLAKESLEIKRKVVEENIYVRSLYPMVKRYVPDLHAHFSTIGVNGMNESIMNFNHGFTIADECGREFALEVMDYIREKLSDFQEETGNLFNSEASPAEGTAYRFAKEDKKRFSGILQAGTPQSPYYTNSTHLPVGYTMNPLEALEHQDELQQKYTGGTVLHIFLGERIQDWKTAANFVKKVCENYKLPYFTLSPVFSICKNHGYLNGEVERCPTCDSDCEIWARIIGYLRPVSEWNIGKKQEFKDRLEYELPPLTNTD